MGSLDRHQRTVLLLASMLAIAAAKSFIQSCNSASQCSSLVAYRTPAAQSLGAIAALFNIDTVSLLAANNLDLRSSLDPGSPQLVIAPRRIVKVPISCSCVDGIWRGNATLYKSRPGDTLASIADALFGKLVTAKQIAQANGIAANFGGAVAAGSTLVIPFSCGCGDPLAGGGTALLMSYVVQGGDTVGELAREYGSLPGDFMALNGVANASELAAGDVVAVPIRACGSSFRRSAYDFGLVVANGSYIITAGHCVQCSCLPNLQQVYCTPAPGVISGSCPDMRCLGTNLTVGAMATAASVQGCNVTSCLYTGFKKKIILSSLQSVILNSCPAPPPPPSYKSAGGSLALPPAAAPGSSGLTTPGVTIPASGNSAFAPGPSTAAAAGTFSQIRFGSLSLVLLLVVLMI
ncbi:lysM domain-containing GPI-anchored protein LYP6 [Selaginella moellendorffii]|nr:lysM domain-containing GPI-anchored protein LYP6 [Selaginella moellendorffii]|eukprot:XP_002975891.2 lysM domain-containing GPI-anchored protein LYP6 [Selaginella moellendorffii]